MRRWILLILLCGWAAPVFAQQAITLRDDITSSGDAVTLNRIQGYGSARIQVTGTYDTTWEVQCSVDGSTFDTDDEVLIVKEGETGAVSEVTDDAVAIWRVSDIAGCSSIRVIATAYASGTQSVVITATEAGGGGGGAGGGGGGNGAIADGVDGNLLASVFDYTSAKPLAVRLTDTDGNYVGAGAGTQYAEDSAAAANPTGTALNLIRADALGALTSADGDNVAARGTDKGELYVKHVDAIPVTDNGGALTVDGTITVTATNLDIQSGGSDLATSTQAGAIQTAVELLDNAVSGAGFNITQMNGVNVSMGNGVSGTGVQRVTIASDSTGTVAVTQGTASNLNAQVVGNVAHDAAASGSPVQIGGFASSSAPVNVSASDVARIWTSLFGAVNVIMRDTSGNAVTAGGVSVTNETTFNPASGLLTPIGGFFDDTSPNSLDEDELGIARLTSLGAIHVNLRDSSGNELQSATDATHDSAAPADGPLGMAEFDDSSPDSVDEGDAGRLRVSANRNLYSTIRDAAGNERGANVNASNELLVAVSSVPSHAVTNAGTFVVQENGAALTALQLLDNIVGVEDAAETAGGGLSMAGSVRRDTAASSAGTTGDNATLNTDSLGRLWARLGDPCSDHARVASAAINTASSGNVEVVALNGSDLIYVCAVDVVSTDAESVQLIYGTGTACATGETDLTGPWPFGASGGISKSKGVGPYYVVPAGNAFCIESSGTGLKAGSVTYVRTAAP